MSSNVNGCFADAVVVVLGVAVCPRAGIAIANERVRILQCIVVPPLSAQTVAEPALTQIGRARLCRAAEEAPQPPARQSLALPKQRFAYISRSRLLPSIAP